ncbi:rust resistance kinase Lr10-like isoform X1 [Carex rostrata]
MAQLTPKILAITAFLVSYYSTPTLLVLVHGKQTYFKDNCRPSRCSKHGPIVRYPFRLDTHAPHCGYDTLILSCSGNNTVLTLPSSDNYNVTSIDYKKTMLGITRYSWNPNCPWFQFSEPNVNDSLFIPPIPVDLIWLDCSDMLTSVSDYHFLAGPMSCLESVSVGHFIYVAYAYEDVASIPSTCTKTKNSTLLTGPKVAPLDSREDISPSEFQQVIRDFAARPVVALYWKDDLINCSMCEKKWWHRCEFNLKTKRSFCRESQMVLKVGLTVGATSLILLVVFAFLYVHHQSRKKKSIRQKIEHFLRNYRVMDSTRYTYNNLKKMTNRFKKRIGVGAFGTVYKGELPNGIPVAVKMLHRTACGGEQFVNEVTTIGRIHHVHIVRLLGYCSEGEKQALVYQFMENGSLDKYIFSTRWRNRHFSMEEMLVVAMGIAEGIEYLHQGCDQRILHFDIKPHNILLDHNLVPKISDFGLSKLCPKDQSYLTISAARGTMGYLAPEMYSRNFGTVSYKSDVYSFGILILEMISGRKNTDPIRGGGVQSEEVYFPEWIYEQLAQGKDLYLVLDVGGNEEIAKKLAIVALWCIQWSPEDRPSMTRIVQMLGENLQNLQMPPNPIVPSSYCIDTSGQRS